MPSLRQVARRARSAMRKARAPSARPVVRYGPVLRGVLGSQVDRAMVRVRRTRFMDALELALANRLVRSGDNVAFGGIRWDRMWVDELNGELQLDDLKAEQLSLGNGFATQLQQVAL